MKTYSLNAGTLSEWKALTGKTDKEIAAEMKVHHISFSRWLNGHRPVPLAAAMELERITSIPLEKLITERQCTPPQPRPHPAVATAEQVIDAHRLPGRTPSSEARTA